MNKPQLSEFLDSLSRDQQKQFFWGMADLNSYVLQHVNCPYGFKLIVQFGGEDQGSDYWAVYQFTDPATMQSLYVKFDGWYASYDGSTYNEWFFVEPEQVIVTQYKRV